MRYYRIIFFTLTIFSIHIFSAWAAKETVFSKQAQDYRKIGYAAYLQGDLEKAYQFFKKAAYLNPQYAVVHNDLGIIYEKRGLKELALKEYLKAINLDPEYAPAYMNLALFYRESGNKERAVFYLRERTRLGKKNDPWREKARQLLKIYEAGQSDSRLEEKDIQKSQEAGVEEVRKMDMARALWEESLKEKKENSVSLNDKTPVLQGHLMKAKLYYEKAAYLQALQELKEAQELDPENTEITRYIKQCQEKVRIEELYVQGREALEKGDFALAIEKIDELLSLDPLYKDAEEIMVLAEKERFVSQTREKEEIILPIPLP
jgi:Flp pilus assembly protein TadD